MRSELRLDEEGRLKSLADLDILDSPPEAPFEKIVSLVKQTLRVPICAVSLVDRDRQWFKASRGLSICETPRDISFCGHAIQDLVPFVVTDASCDPQFANNPLVTGEPHIRSYAGIPLTMSDGYNLGTLCAIDTRPRAFSQQELAILASFSRLVVDELELRRIASQDMLTGALSRRAWLEAAEREFKRASRDKEKFTILAMDIDHFKSINDRFGHASGDAVLKEFARIVSAQVRQSDLFGRLGGEEFALALPGTRLSEANILAQRICEAIRDHAFEGTNGQPVTVSIGLTEKIFVETSIQRTLERADKALYQAKRTGRNKVSLSFYNINFLEPSRVN